MKIAATMVKSDPVKSSITLYRLGYAYAKSNQMAQAKEILTEAASVEGPFQQSSKDLLLKVGKPTSSEVARQSVCQYRHVTPFVDFGS